MLRVVPFRRLWYSTALSSLGDWLGLLATTALATDLASTRSEQGYALSGVVIVKLLPAMFLGPLAGAFADRFDRRLTMVISDAVRFVFFVSIPIAPLLVANDTAYVWLLVMSFLIECVSLFWMPAKDASVPNLVRRDQIEPANQLSLVTTYGLTPVAGAGLFALLALITNVLARDNSFFARPDNSVTLALYFNAATFLFGAIVVWFIPEISGEHERRRADGDQPTLVFLIKEGASFIRHSRLLGGLIIGLSGAFVAAGAVIGAGKFFTTLLGGGNAAYGTMFGAVFVGLGSGMAIGPKIAKELSRRRMFGLAIVFAALCLVLASIMPQVALAIIFVVGLGVGAGIAYLTGVTLLGTEVDDVMRGRVFALMQSLIRVVLVLSMSVVGLVYVQVHPATWHIAGGDYRVDGSRLVLLVGGFLALVAGLWAYRKLDDREQVGLWVDLKTALRGDSSARRRMRNGGVFIAFEGGEGSGKSTQINLLAAALREAGHEVVVTFEPGGTEAGRGIRDLVLHHQQPLSPRAEALLFAADRAHHVDTVVRPALDARQIVLSDRYIDSSLAYQGIGRGLTIDEIRRISRWATRALTPDLTVLLDVPAEIGLARARDTGPGDKLESESLQFHERVREAFRRLAESDPRYYRVLDATRPPDEVAADVTAIVAQLLPPGRVAEKVST